MSAETLATAEPLWRALCQTPELSGVLAAWESILGFDPAVLRPFLAPVPKLSESYPCPFSPIAGCSRAVIQSKGECLGVCESKNLRCDSIKLTKTDLVAYDFDFLALVRWLREELELGGEGPAEEEPLARTFLVGDLSPTAGVHVPVYFTMQWCAEKVLGIAERLRGRLQSEFVLVTPQAYRMRVERVLLFALEDCTAIDEKHQLVLDAAVARERLLAFVPAPGERARPMEKTKAKDGMVFFPTPAGASWPDVRLRLVDGHTVSVQVRGEGGVFTYAQLGLASQKNAAPTLQWRLLTDFAHEHGTITWDSRSASRKNRKRRELLSRDLERFFRIDGDPIELTRDGKGWRTRFAIAPAG